MAIDFLSLLVTVTDAEKKSKNYSTQDLWLIQFELETEGPYHTSQITELIKTHKEQLSQCMACNMKSKKWKPLFHHSAYQQRTARKSKPVIKKEERHQSEFHLLIAGQKLGPYSQTRINSLIDSKEIKMQSLISADGGKSWRKIYQYPIFDRRSIENNIAFDAPDEEQFEKSKVYTKEYLAQLRAQGDTKTGLEGALVARKKHIQSKVQKTLNSPKTSSLPSFANKEVLEDSEQGSKKQMIIRVAIVAMLLLMVPLFLIDGKKGSRVSKKRSKTQKTDYSKGQRSTASSKSKDSNTRSAPTPSRAKNRSKTSYSSRSRKVVDNDDIAIPSRSKYRVAPDSSDFDALPRSPRFDADKQIPRRKIGNRLDQDLDNEDILELDETADSEEDGLINARGLAMDDDLDPEDLEPDNFSNDFDGNIDEDIEF